MVGGNDPGFAVCHQEIFTRTKRTLKEPPSRGRAGREGSREGRDRPGETESKGGREGQKETEIRREAEDRVRGPQVEP